MLNQRVLHNTPFEPSEQGGLKWRRAKNALPCEVWADLTRAWYRNLTASFFVEHYGRVLRFDKKILYDLLYDLDEQGRLE